MVQSFSYELISPERASEMLARSHPRQRKAGVKKVAAYVRTLTDGRWNDHVPQPVMLSPDGLLLNGGHRLTAVVESGIPAMLLVARDVPDDVFDVIDTGLARQPAQFVRGANPGQTANAARWVMWYERRFDRAPSSVSMAFDLDEVVDFMDDNTELLTPVVASAVACAKASKVPAGLNAAVLLIGNSSTIPESVTGSWIEGLTTGAGLEEGDPRLALRAWTLSPTRSAKSRTMASTYYIVVSAFNAYAHGESMAKTMSPRGATWPRIGESPADYLRRAHVVSGRKRRARRPSSASASTAFDEAVSMAASS